MPPRGAPTGMLCRPVQKCASATETVPVAVLAERQHQPHPATASGREQEDCTLFLNTHQPPPARQPAHRVAPCTRTMEKL